MKRDNKHLVFVYGTLKNGNGLHGVLRQCKCVAPEAYTIDSDFKMVYSSGERGFPFVFKVDKGTGRHIKGEVYEVDDTILAELDAIEGVPYMYHREVVPVSLRARKNADCYMYVSPVERNGKECGPENTPYYEY